MITFELLTSIAPVEVKNILAICRETEQRPDFHPEGNVYNHIKIVVERAIKNGNHNLIVAGLFHDLGKAFTTKLSEKGNWTSPGHEDVSVKILERNRDWVTDYYYQLINPVNYDMIHFIIKNHMRIQQMDKMRAFKQKELMNAEYFPELELFSKMDDMLNDNIN